MRFMTSRYRIRSTLRRFLPPLISQARRHPTRNLLNRLVVMGNTSRMVFRLVSGSAIFQYQVNGLVAPLIVVQLIVFQVDCFSSAKKAH
jgi:hypothetical protein